MTISTTFITTTTTLTPTLTASYDDCVYESRGKHPRVEKLKQILCPRDFRPFRNDI